MQRKEPCGWAKNVGSYLAGGRTYMVTEPISWEIGVEGSGLWLTVPKGFYFDVSVPLLLRPFLDPHDPRFLKAAALHDFALAKGFDRTTAAAAFSEGLRAGNVSRTLRLLMVLSVTAWKWE